MDVAVLPLKKVADLEVIVVRLSGMSGRAVTRRLLLPALEGAPAGPFWSSRWGTPDYFAGHPFLTRDAAEFLRDRGVALVGIDSLSIDGTTDPHRPAHGVLLGAGIPIVKNLANLHDLPTDGFRFTTAPMRIEGMGACPVRA